MAKNKRDDFTASTVKVLRDRVNNLCSNPDCGNLTIEPKKTDNNKTNITGTAAHISAAAVGGPRYDMSMPSEERKSINNGIWLCNHCTRKIDIEPEAYSVDLLKEWKKKAELKVLANSNKKFYTETEFEKEAQSRVLQSHMSNQVFGSVANQTLNVITKGIQKELKTLDPRLNISCDHINGTTHYRIDAVSESDEPVKVKITPTDANEFSEKYGRLVEYGEFFHSSIENFISNSDAINSIFPKDVKDGIVTIKPTNLRKGIIEITDQDDNVILDLEGDFIIGRKSFSICAYKFDNSIEISIKNIPLNVSSDTNNVANISLRLENWQGIDIRFLPYFDKIKKIYEKLENSTSLDFKILVDGLEIYKAINLDMSKKLAWINNFLNYTNSCANIAKKNNLSITFNNECSFSSEEHRQIYEISELLCSKIELKKFKGSMTVNPSSIELVNSLVKDTESELIMFQDLDIQSLNIFNNMVDLKLYIKHTFRNPQFMLLKKDLTENSYKFEIKEKTVDSLYLREGSLNPFEYSQDQVVLEKFKK